jgi:hypothetical protein
MKQENNIRMPHETLVVVGAGFGLSMLAILAMIGAVLLAQEADAAVIKVKEHEPTESYTGLIAPDVLSRAKPIEGWVRY